MNAQRSVNRLVEKTSLHTIQIELQQGYNLSPVEAQVLAHRLQQLVDEQTGFARQQGQITYQAIALDEPPGKPLRMCRKVPVHLTVMDEGDILVWATEGAGVLRRLRVHRLTYEALLQGGGIEPRGSGVHPGPQPQDHQAGLFLLPSAGTTSSFPW